MQAVTAPRFNRFLIVLLVVLYLISLAWFTRANWLAEGSQHEIWFHAVNALILSIPLVMFYGSIYVLITAWRQRRITGQIDTRTARFIHLAPRIAAIAIIFFVSLFSLDVFDMEGTPLQLAGAFLMHSLPSIVMIVLLVIAWKRPVVGFVAFLLAGLFFLRFVFLGGGLGHFLLFSGPLLLVSVMFYLDWRWKYPADPAAEIQKAAS